ncbi:MAG: hypothetical protein ACUVUE_00145 [Candidatus Bathycorpusculaceae bacterium]
MSVILFGICVNEAGASQANSISLQGNVGFTIDLVFPEEARPGDLVTHNMTLTATTAVFWFNVTLVVKALVNVDWQQVYSVEVPSRSVPANEKISEQGMFTVPEGVHDRLFCFVYVSTQTYAASGEASYTFYTTQIRSMTYDELLNGYNELLNDYNQLMANYSRLLADYEALLESHDELSIRYDALNSNYTLMLDQYESLQTAYSSLNSTYYSQKESQEESYDSLRADCDSLQASYSALNATCNDLRTENSNLGRLVDSARSELSLSRNLMYASIATALALGAFALYVVRKKPPVVYIRKQEV